MDIEDGYHQITGMCIFYTCLLTGRVRVS